MLDYPTSIYKFRDNIPERLHWNLVEIQCLRNRKHELISRIRFQKINKVLKQVSSRKTQESDFKIQQSIKTKCQAEELKNQISKVNKVSKQSVKANFPSLI